MLSGTSLFPKRSAGGFSLCKSSTRWGVDVGTSSAKGFLQSLLDGAADETPPCRVDLSVQRLLRLGHRPPSSLCLIDSTSPRMSSFTTISTTARFSHSMKAPTEGRPRKHPLARGPPRPAQRLFLIRFYLPLLMSPLHRSVHSPPSHSPVNEYLVSNASQAAPQWLA